MTWIFTKHFFLMSLQTGSKRQLPPRLRRLLDFAVLEAAEGIDVVVKDSTVVSAGFSPEVLFINIGARARALFPAKFWRPSRRRSFRGRRAGGFARRGFMGQAPLVKPLDRPGQSDRWPEPAMNLKENLQSRGRGIGLGTHTEAIGMSAMGATI